MSTQSAYHIPHGSHWPIVATLALFVLFGGAAVALNGLGLGTFLMGIGVAVLVYMFVGWFGTVIDESRAGLHNKQVDVSYRWGMSWFIFSEVMFFACFFGALFYARLFSVPWLGGAGTGYATHELLWSDFQAVWPLLKPPDTGLFQEAKGTIAVWQVPVLNTVVLVSSSVTIYFAHEALRRDQRTRLRNWLLVTVLLGFTFVGLQATEYVHAYQELGLTLNSGVFGAVFFMLTGFHGCHVIIGALILTVILLRCVKGHFSPNHHFAFEAAAWYWHFVDIVWICVMLFAYIL